MEKVKHYFLKQSLEAKLQDVWRSLNCRKYSINGKIPYRVITLQ